MYHRQLSTNSDINKFSLRESTVSLSFLKLNILVYTYKKISR